MAGLLEYTKNGQVTEPPLYRFMRGNVQSFLNSIPDPSKMTPEQQLAMGLNANPIMGLLGMTAYHGSPYLFDKFDIKKLGSGEGAQTYGHGMYFAENPEVAKSYAKMLAGPEQTAAEYLKMYKTPENAISALEYGITPNLTNTAKQHAQKAIDTLKSGKELTGNMYKVDIPDTQIPKMLNWDISLQKQPEVLKTLGVGEKEINRYNAIKKELNAMPGQYDIDIPKEKAMFDKHTALERELNDIGLHKTGQKYYEDLIKKYGSAKNVSEELNKKGITGIKYLDAHSRGILPRIEERPLTSNYVLFDPSEVKILERNNKGLLK